MSEVLQNRIQRDLRQFPALDFSPKMGCQWVGDAVRISLLPTSVDPVRTERDMQLTVQFAGAVRNELPKLEEFSAIGKALAFSCSYSVGGIRLSETQTTNAHGLAYFRHIPDKARCTLRFLENVAVKPAKPVRDRPASRPVRPECAAIQAINNLSPAQVIHVASCPDCQVRMPAREPPCVPPKVKFMTASTPSAWNIGPNEEVKHVPILKEKEREKVGVLAFRGLPILTPDDDILFYVRVISNHLERHETVVLRLGLQLDGGETIWHTIPVIVGRVTRCVVGISEKEVALLRADLAKRQGGEGERLHLLNQLCFAIQPYQ